MIEVGPGLYVGSAQDYEKARREVGWSFVLAAKLPWHKQTVGYTTPNAPRSHPEYLIAERPDFIALNLIDGVTDNWGALYIAGFAVGWIRRKVFDEYPERRVGVFCNHGVSRSPTLALLYLWSYGFLPLDPQEALSAFRVRYPRYEPSPSMRYLLGHVMGLPEGS